jgi:phospholipase D1/2
MDQATRSTKLEPILAPGRNCWTIADVESSGLLIDGRSYYRAFYEAARKARRYILIAGWRFNSDVRVLRGKDAEAVGGDLKFLPFLDRLCEHNPELHVYVLAWNFSYIYIHEWEWFQKQKFERGAHGRLHFRFDNQHPIGGSHHQKFVVVDSSVGFVGGLDFNADDWDNRAHLAYHPDRADSGREPHDPYHDIQAYLIGPAAKELSDYFCRRWHVATGEELSLPPPHQGSLPAIRPSVPVTADRIALSRNHPRTLQNSQSVCEILHLYLDAIAAAEKLIYLENQYFSSRVIFRALLERMRAVGRPKLEIVLVLPKRYPSWVELVAMGPPRVRMLDTLRETARQTGHRLGAYYPLAAAGNGREVHVVLHSKLLIVDDRFLTIGSCNTNNRSMGLDSELNVSWEALSSNDREVVRSIRRARVSLLAEHSGLHKLPLVRRELRRRTGLVDYLDRVANLELSRLRHLTREALLEHGGWFERLAHWSGFSFDPGRPIEETLLRHLTRHSENSSPGSANGSTTQSTEAPCPDKCP